MTNNNYNSSNNGRFDFMELLSEIKRKLYVIIIFVLVAGLAGFLISKYLITPKYEAAVNMIVNTKQDNTNTVTNDNITSAQKLVDTYSIIIKSNTILNQVIDNLDLDTDYDKLVEDVSVEAVNETQIMRVAVRNSDKDLAVKIVEQISEIAPDAIVETAEAGSCKVISQVMASEDPVYPNTVRNIEIAVILGLIVSLAIIIISTVTKVKKIVDDEDVENYLDLPVLGVLPEIGGED